MKYIIGPIGLKIKIKHIVFSGNGHNCSLVLKNKSFNIIAETVFLLYLFSIITPMFHSLYNYINDKQNRTTSKPQLYSKRIFQNIVN